MPTLREWKERRPASDLKQTVIFYHPSFGYYRLVNNLFQEATFGGDVYEPARFEIVEPAQDGEAVLSTKISFAMFTQDVKGVLKGWTGAARMIPIQFTYQIWDQIGDTTPLKTYHLFVKDVSGDADNVSITVGMSNPLSVTNPIIYTTRNYPGLSNS